MTTILYQKKKNIVIYVYKKCHLEYKIEEKVNILIN
jgi:hypothetical protein